MCRRSRRVEQATIGTEHLLLGLLRVERSFASEILRGFKVDLASAREKVVNLAGPWDVKAYNLERIREALERKSRGQTNPQETVEIHGKKRSIEITRASVSRCKQTSWHWVKKTWQPRDIVVKRTNGLISVDLKLSEDPNTCELVKNGWKEDLCVICESKLFESLEPDHSTSYTNGRDWLCLECFDKFFSGSDYFDSSYSDIT